MTTKQTEEWRPIPSTFDPSIDLSLGYEVSNLGNVRRINGKAITPCLNDRGYLVVGLGAGVWRKSFKVHRLIAAAFVPNPDKKPDINHLNGKKTCNHAENLEWTTPGENAAHAAATGLLCPGESKRGSILKPDAVRAIREKRASGVNRQSLADEYGVSINTIKAVITRRLWKKVT